MPSFIEKLRNPNRKNKGISKAFSKLGKSKVMSTKVKRKAGRPKGTTKYKGGVYAYRRRLRAQKRLQTLQQRESEFQNSFQPTPILQTPREKFTADRGQYKAIKKDRGSMRAGEVVERPTNLLASGPSHILSGTAMAGGPMKSPVQHVDLVHKPVVNPHGDYFTDVDLLSGKPVLQRRVRERWAEEDI